MEFKNFKQIEEAAKNGDANGLFQLALHYYNGTSYVGKKNLSKAIMLFALSAQKGNDQALLSLEILSYKYKNADAQYYLGLYYLDAKGVEKNPSKAIELFKLSAKQGNTSALFALGYCYYYGIGVEKNLVEAFKLFKLAANKYEDLAEQTLEILTEEFSPVQLCNLGVCYYLGKEDFEKDYKEAVRLFELSAKRNDAQAEYNLGICYYLGNGVEKNLKKAVKYFKKSAKHGNSSAQYMLGYCYNYGNGIEKDICTAFHWYRLAAENGNSKAKWALGMIDECSLSESELEFYKQTQKKQEVTTSKPKKTGYSRY